MSPVAGLLWGIALIFLIGIILVSYHDRQMRPSRSRAHSS